MNKFDKEYISLLQDILVNGKEKDTRAGRVKSVFGRQIRFDLKDGFPILTTKKVFTKGIIHELLWFLQHPMNSNHSMNIEYLIRNGVHIWDDDAYRWFKERIVKEYKGHIKDIVVCLNEDDGRFLRKKPSFQYWISAETKKNDNAWLENITKEEFLDLTLQRVELRGNWMGRYRFGDLGPVYGTQWRCFGHSYIDQIQNIIDTLKTNPNDRRMLCVAFNPDALDDVALPPCHVMFQFYTRELSNEERLKIFNERHFKGKIPKKYYAWLKEYSEGVENDADILMPSDGSNYDIADIPKYGLSCMFNMRSNDYMCGTPFNWSQYSFLTHIIAKLVNMVPDELVYSVGDCHIYLNHMDGINEQLSRKGSDITPKLIIHGNQKSIEDFKYEDFEIVDYYPDPPIKFPLNVG